MFGSGQRQTPKEALRENQKTLRKQIRALERERDAMMRKDANKVIAIKVAAREGRVSAARILAKDLVRTRNAADKCSEMCAQLQSVCNQMQMMSSIAAMTDAMRSAARAMHQMNRQTNLPAMQRIMAQYEREGEMMDLKQEVMNDTIDGVAEQEGDAEDEDAIINQVFDEIGIKMAADLADAPTKRHVAVSTTTVRADAQPADDVTARLDNLRKP